MTNILLIILTLLLLPPCATEDSTYCHWDAQSQGNGTGSSFVTLDEDSTFYLGTDRH